MALYVKFRQDDHAKSKFNQLRGHWLRSQYVTQKWYNATVCSDLLGKIRCLIRESNQCHDPWKILGHWLHNVKCLLVRMVLSLIPYLAKNNWHGHYRGIHLIVPIFCFFLMTVDKHTVIKLWDILAICWDPCQLILQGNEKYLIVWRDEIDTKFCDLPFRHFIFDAVRIHATPCQSDEICPNCDMASNNFPMIWVVFSGVSHL